MGRALFALLVMCMAAVRAPAQAPEYRPSPEEQAFVDLFAKSHKPIEASEAARAYLTAHPDSFVSCTVLGWYYLQEEGDLPRAYYYFSRGRKTLERGYEGRWSPDSPWRYYERTLSGLFLTAQLMERYEVAIRVLDAYNAHFTKKRIAEYAWSLMKLGRTREARERVAEALAGEDKDQQESALNALGAIQGEENQMEESYETFTRLYERTHRPGGHLEVTSVRNQGDTALKLLRFDEGERLLLESTKYFSPSDSSNPWQDLAILYMEEGRLSEAVDAVKKMQDWAYHSLPLVAQGNWNYRQTITACLLFYCGYTDEALRLAERVAFRPDRHGAGSAKREQWEASSLLFCREVLQDHAERLREEMSWSRSVSWPGLALSRLGDLAQAWSAGRQASRIIMSHGWMNDTLRYVGAKSVVAFPGGELQAVEAVGPGVTEAELRGLLVRSGPMSERERPFLLLFLGACQLNRSDSRGALGNIRKAEESLPAQTAATRTQAIALDARASAAVGDVAGESHALAVLMERDPGAVRRFGLRLPAVVSSAGGAAAEKAADLLRRSPRLTAGRRGYTVVVEQTASGALQGGLDAPDGSVLSRLRVNPGKDGDATAREFCRQFHLKAFAPKLDLSQQEINSLEGSTLASQDAREQLRGLLGRTPPEKLHPTPP